VWISKSPLITRLVEDQDEDPPEGTSAAALLAGPPLAVDVAAGGAS
jgi:hypothetical protein